MGLATCLKCRKQLVGYIRYCRARKLSSQAIATKLNEFGLLTSRGKKWDFQRINNHFQSHRMLECEPNPRPPVHCSSMLAQLTPFGEQVVDLILNRHADLRNTWVYEHEVKPKCEHNCYTLLLGFILSEKMKSRDYEAIAAKLNSFGLVSATGKEWYGALVHSFVRFHHIHTFYLVEDLTRENLPCFRP